MTRRTKVCSSRPGRECTNLSWHCYVGSFPFQAAITSGWGGEKAGTCALNVVQWTSSCYRDRGLRNLDLVQCSHPDI